MSADRAFIPASRAIVILCAPIALAALGPPALDATKSELLKPLTTTPVSWKPKPAEQRKPAARPKSSKAKKSDSKTEKPATASKPAEKRPQVEVYVPSISKLSAAARQSKASRIVETVLGLVPRELNETDEGLDVKAVLSLAKQVLDWPDTSMGIAIYSQDRDGRPRWSVRVDWPLEDLHTRVAAILKRKEASKLLKDVKLVRSDKNSYRIELEDVLLATLRSCDGGSLIASTLVLDPPSQYFGQPAPDAPGKEAAGESKSLVYCRLNLDAGDEEERGSSVFSQIAGVSSIRYAASVLKDGTWSERFNLQWNPLLGTMLKAAFKKVEEPFECPKDSFLVAVLHFGFMEGWADGMTGLPAGTLRGLVDDEVAVVVTMGSGFLPMPDTFFQARAGHRARLEKAIRKAMKEDTDRRKEDDRPAAWREGRIDDQAVFWREPGADQASGLGGGGSRSVIFFDERSGVEENEESKSAARVIIALTSTGPDDALRRWKEISGKASSTIAVPGSSKAHWEARIHWKKVYEFLQPYVTMLAGTIEGSTMPRDAEELADALVDSQLRLRIEYKGLDIRHGGPLPLGVAYVPAVVAASLSSGASYGSEAQRERTACQNLRVLHHHAKLFRKDYGRWPATVAELDGYVDFASHPHLLRLSPRGEGFIGGFAKLFTAGKKPPEREDERAIDDSLYEIEWSESEWKLKLRKNEFAKYVTIYIDQDGEIGRVERPGAKKDADARADAETGAKRKAG